MPRKQHFTLDFTPDYDFILLGIYCSYRDYRLCFELNRALPICLRRQDDLEIKMEKKGSSSLFPVFFDLTEDEEEIFLISNKGSNGHFVQEMKQTDYFLIIRNASRYTSVDLLIPKIRSIRIVSSVIDHDPSSLKSTENFLLLEPVYESDGEKPKMPPLQK